VKKILSITITTVLFFAIGSVGTYFAIPKVFPEHAMPADSLALDSLATLPTVATGADMSDLPDSIAFAMAVLDSVLSAQDDSMAVDLGHMLPSVITMLRDSLGALETSRQQLAADRDSALARVRALESELTRAIIPEPDASAVAKTLAGMDEKQLRPILQSLGDNALAALYYTASARDKRLLIAAMPSERAVRLVQRQLAANERTRLTGEASADSAAMEQ
jgi:hypothetical protein